MRRLLLFPLMLIAASAFGQQDIFKWRIAAHAGITRSLSDIESSYSDVNWERSRSYGLELSKSLGYGFSIGLGVDRAKLSGYDVLTGRKDRALNFMSEINTAQLELTFRMDNGKLLKYDARFAPFITIGVGAGEYDVFGDLYSASGSRYYYWNDGSIRDQAESGINAADAALIEQDGNFETRLTDLATEDNKPKDQNFVFIPARIGLKWRISDRMAAELYYGFNWTFTDGIDDVHDAYPLRQPEGELAYISNPTGRAGQRGDPGTSDKYQSIGLNLAYYFGRRSTSYRMEPVYVDDRSLPPPPPKALAPPQAVPEPPAAPEPKNVVINVEHITVGSLSVDTLVVGTIITRHPTIPDTASEYSIRRSKLDSILATKAGLDTIRMDSLRALEVDSLKGVAPDSLRAGLPERSVVQSPDTITSATMGTLGTKRSDTLVAPPGTEPERRNLEELPQDTVVPLLQDTVDDVQLDTTKVGGFIREGRQIPQDTAVETRTANAAGGAAAVYQKEGVGEGRVDTVYVDRPVPSGGYEQRASGGTQQPQQVVHREQSNGGSAKVPIPIPIPIIIPHKKTKVVQDTTLQDSLRKLEAENQKLRYLADSLKNDTTPMGVSSANVGLLDTTPLPPGVRPEDYAFIINDLLADRIATLERYIELMDGKGSAAETDSLQQRIAMMDVELEKLRSKGNVTKDSLGAGLTPGMGQTLMDSISFSLGSSQVGSADRARLLAMGKRIAAAHADRVLVTGQTDRSGNPALNLKLSQKRADAVKRVLVEAGVPSAAITAKGLGEKLAQDVHNESERIVVVQAVIPAKKAQDQ